VEVDPPTQPVWEANEPTTDEEHHTGTEVPFSIYTKSEKKWISFVAGFGAIF
jgi:hypothetical protein